MHTELPENICEDVGVIRDVDMRKAIADNILLLATTTNPSGVRQASYELRLSEDVEFLVLPEVGSGQPLAKFERPANGIGDILRIEPGQTVKVLTMEIFNLPTDVVAHVTPVGNVYKVGLSPNTTYADPGFEGQLYMILCNYSSRIVELKVGDPIARAEFVKLAKSAERPHPGFNRVSEPSRWPRRIDRREEVVLQQLGIDALLSELEKKDPPNLEHSFIARELRKQVSTGFADMSGRLTRLERQIAWVHLIGYAICAALAVWAIGLIWYALPHDIQDKLAGEAVKEVMALLVVIVPFLFQGVRRVIRLALIGKQE